MPKFNIEVQWHYKSFDYRVFEVEAETMEEAKKLALEMAPNVGNWHEGQIYDGNYEVNDSECEEVK